MKAQDTFIFDKETLFRKYGYYLPFTNGIMTDDCHRHIANFWLVALGILNLAERKKSLCLFPSFKESFSVSWESGREAVQICMGNMVHTQAYQDKRTSYNW